MFYSPRKLQYLSNWIFMTAGSGMVDALAADCRFCSVCYAVRVILVCCLEGCCLVGWVDFYWANFFCYYSTIFSPGFWVICRVVFIGCLLMLFCIGSIFSGQPTLAYGLLSFSCLCIFSFCQPLQATICLPKLVANLNFK